MDLQGEIETGVLEGEGELHDPAGLLQGMEEDTEERGEIEEAAEGQEEDLPTVLLQQDQPGVHPHPNQGTRSDSQEQRA